METATTDLQIPLGAPNWMDLVNDQPDEAVEFYTQLFGWTCHEAPPQFEGYRYFQKDGEAVGGVMISQPEWQAPNSWSIFLRSDDVRETARKAEAAGGKVIQPPMDVENNGSLVILHDAGGAVISAWQPNMERGFGVMREENTPLHFELQTRDYDKSVEFYRQVFGWEPNVESDTPEFRYSTFSASDEDKKAGIMDASAYMDPSVPNHWSVYIGVSDADATLQRAEELGAKILSGVDDTPYGRLAVIVDPTGAVFKIRG